MFNLVMISFSLISFAVLVGLIFVVLMDLDPIKKTFGLCWKFGCIRRASNCRADKRYNGPMCDRHCRRTSYHDWFCGCHDPNGIPGRDRFMKEYVIDPEIFVGAGTTRPKKYLQ